MTMQWSSPAIVAAARSGEIGTVIRLARKAQGLTQAELGATCGYSQSVVSRIERGQRHAYDIRVLQQIADTLGVPRQLLGLASETGELPEPPVNRRDFLAGAGAAAASTFLPLPAFADPTAEAVRTITAAQRRLDATLPSRYLAESVRSHLRLADRAVKTAPEVDARIEMAAALSEIAGFAGWLHWDMYDLGSARRHYDLAITSAREAGDPLLAAYMTGSLAAFAAHLGDGPESLGLVGSARQQLGAERPAIADAWLYAVAALAHATAGDERSTLAALDHSQAAAERVPTEERPPWPWVFTFDPAKVAAHRLACAVRLGRPTMAFGAAEDARTLLAGSTKQAALWRLDHATAHLQNGDVDEAFTIATSVLDVTKDQQSARVVERARALRRGYADQRPSAAALAFDEHVRTVGF
jgi:transcriptional regulator with XRE-family HTH domain